MKVLYKIKSGSHLYGLNTPTSDIDYVGVYVDDSLMEFLDPFNNRDEVDLSIKSKLENGKNSSDAIDEKYYHLKKFVKLCSDCNPNILEMLFAPKECVEYVDPLFQEYILDNAWMFINKKLIDRFIGYAKSQEQKSYTKSENYIVLEKFERELKCYAEAFSKNTPLRDLVEMDYNEFNKVFKVEDKIIFREHTKTNIEPLLVLGEMEFPLGLHVKDAIDRIADRFKRASHRIEGIFVNKYEPKFMSNTIRLLDEGYQLLTEKRIVFPFTGETYETIMNIKLGKTSIEDVPNIVNTYKEQLAKTEQDFADSIPDKPDYDAIKEYYYDLVSNIYNIYKPIFAMAY